MSRNIKLRNLDVPLLALPVHMPLAQAHVFPRFLSSSMRTMGLQFDGTSECSRRVDVRHKVFGFIFIADNKDGVHRVNAIWRAGATITPANP